MHLIDYTHPERVPALRLPNDRRSDRFYLRLDELPADHPYHASSWALFRHPEWLEGGSAWLQAHYIVEDMVRYAMSAGLSGTLCPVVGSGDIAFDEALAQALRTFGYQPKVAEVMPRRSQAQSH
ncbi:hypothetical protein [Burkholderia ambifaria]|uniref:hypothetical protein n=1 Tax=Burkholderia ambifaria TaxID=152480 RepID=UPI000F8131C2|nr:hypothetical protein [Burkholderia ambifaria]